jgi:hypothetical protein
MERSGRGTMGVWIAHERVGEIVSANRRNESVNEWKE